MPAPLRCLSALSVVALVAGLTSGSGEAASAAAPPADAAPAAVPTGNAFADGYAGIPGATEDKLTFPAGDMSAPAVVKSESNAPVITGYDFTPDGSVLYGIDDENFRLVTVDQTTGEETPVGPLTPAPPLGFDWFDLSIDPVTGAAFAAADNGSDIRVYSLNLSTAVVTLLPAAGLSAARLVDMSINCAGQMYATATNTNSLYRIDLASGTLTSIGDLGVDIELGQGIDFDNATGVLHAWLFKWDMTNHYSRIDLATGAATEFPGGSPDGAFEGAIKTRCPAPAATIGSGPSGRTPLQQPTFGFAAAGESIECSLDQGAPAFRPCAPSSYQAAGALAEGDWTFRVRATYRGVTAHDARTFTVVDCDRLRAAVSIAEHRLTKAKKALTRAKRAGNKAKIARAKKRVKKAKHQLAAARAAQAAAGVCRG